jgi:hypothetical protein
MLLGAPLVGTIYIPSTASYMLAMLVAVPPIGLKSSYAQQDKCTLWRNEQYAPAIGWFYLP